MGDVRAGSEGSASELAESSLRVTLPPEDTGPSEGERPPCVVNAH